MAQIQLVQVWYEGNQLEANVFNCYLSYDNLIDSATIRYQLIKLDEQSSQTLVSGELSINGDDYESWNASTDANAFIYDWAATKLNLTIVTL